jgi:hypothetical protein
MSKKLLQYYQSKMQTGGKVLPLYAEGDPIPARYVPIPRATGDIRVRMPVIAKTAAEARAARAFNNGTIRPAKSQNRFAKALAIAANPVTAASYAVKRQRIPDNFDRAETNRYDIATSVVNPFSYLKQAVDTKRDLEEGNYGSAALNAMGILPTRLPNFGRITSANLDGFLGKQLNNVNRKMEHLRGKNNEGVFMMRDRDDIVIKLEDANRTAHFTDTPEFAHTNMAEKMRDIPDNLPISKTLYQLDDLRLKNYKAPMRASFMKRVTGVPGGQLAPSQFVKIPDKSYQELYSNLKTLRNNDLAFDYFGNNYLYNPNTQQFGLFDIGLQPKNRGYWADDVYGASSKELFGLETSGKNIKEAIREKMSGDFRYTMEPEYDAFYDGASKLSLADLQAITAEGSRRISQQVKDALANMNYYAEGGPVDPPYPIRGQVKPRATQDNTRVAPSDVVFYTDQGYQYAQSQYKKAKEFHEKWMNSPMYNRMIQKSDPTQAEDITKRRKKNMEGVKFKYVPVQPKDNPNTGGFSNSVTGDVTILPRGVDVHGMGTHELSHSIDRPSKGTIILQGLKNLIFNDDDKTVTDTWNKSRLMPTNDINRISKMAGRNQSIYTKQNTSKEDKEWFQYVTNPTETRARLNDIRQSAYESGLYDPFNEEVTPAIYIKLRDHRYEKGKNRGFDAMRQLRGVYTDEQIHNLLNSVSKTNRPPAEVENYMMSTGGPVDPPVREITYTHQPGMMYDGLNPIGPGEIYMLKRTVTPYTKKRDIRRYTQAPADPRQVNFISNYAGAIGEPLSKNYGKYPTAVPFEGEKHWNIDRFIIDPAFRFSSNTMPKVTDFGQAKKNVLADMYKYNMLQGQDRKEAFRNAKKFVRTEVNPRVNSRYQKEMDRLEHVHNKSITNFTADNPFIDLRNVNNAESFSRSNPNYKDYYENPLTERDMKKISRSYLKNFKKMSGKESRQTVKDWITAADEYDRKFAYEMANPVDRPGPSCPPGYTFNMEQQDCVPIKELYKNGGQHGGLDRWFAEKWVDVKSGKPCGRQEGESRAYPACRPSRRVNSGTPKTSSEMSPSEKARFKREKTSSQRISYNHKRNK